MSFAPIERTQLLEISAEDGSRSRTRLLANRYAEVFVRRVNAQHDRGEAPTTIAVSEPAALPVRPVRPNPPLYLGLGRLFALLLAAGVVLLRERFDDRIGRPTATRCSASRCSRAFRCCPAVRVPRAVRSPTSCACCEPRSISLRRPAAGDRLHGQRPGGGQEHDLANFALTARPTASASS